MQQLQERLAHHKSKGLMRDLLVPSGVDFSSNDYLGFAHDKVLRERFIHRLKETPVGASGSRLLRGNLQLYEETEQLLANFVGREAALLFPSGYAANLGLLSALLQPGDLVFSDALNHASIIDGIRLSHAEKIIFPHGDYVFLENQLADKNQHKGLKVIVTESLFSMEGTQADLRKLAALATQFNALLIVDEAHSTGLWGKSLVATLGLTTEVFATTHTAGKSLGASGAWVAGSCTLREYLIQFARSFMFSTAPIPAMALLLQESMRFYDEVGKERANTVLARAQQLRSLLSFHGVAKNDSPIISIFIGENKRALEISRFLQDKSWDVRAIRPPTVPIHTDRLRVTVKWGNSEEQLLGLARDLGGL